jgi:hypothetical protein
MSPIYTDIWEKGESIMKEWMKSKSNSEQELSTLGKIGGLGIGALALYRFHKWLKVELGEATTEEIAKEKGSSFLGGLCDTTVDLLQYPVIGAAVLGTGYLSLKAVQLFNSPNYVTIKVVPVAGTQTDMKQVATMLQVLANYGKGKFWEGKRWFTWRIVRDEGLIHFYFLVPENLSLILQQQIKLGFPKAVVRKSDMPIDFIKPGVGSVGHMKLASRRKWLGLDGSLNNIIGEILYTLSKQTVIDIRFTPTRIKEIQPSWLKKQIRKIRRKPLTEKELIELEGIRERFDNTRAFDVSIHLWSKNSIQTIANTISELTSGNNRLVIKPYTYFPDWRNPFLQNKLNKLLQLFRVNKLNHKELTSLISIPQPEHIVMERIATETDRIKPKQNEFRGEYAFGTIDHPEVNRPAGLNITTLTNHGVIAGMSGGGKGSLLHTFMKDSFLPAWIKDGKKSPGFTLCDPHSTGIYLIINQLLDMERRGIEIPWDRVKVASFGKLGVNHYPVAFNIFHLFDHDDVDEVAADVSSTVLSAFDSGNLSKSSAYLDYAAQGLLYLKKATINDITKLFTQQATALREQAIFALRGNNEIVCEWFVKKNKEINDKKKDINIDAIDTRVAPFVAKKSMQRLFVRKGNYFDVQSILKDGDLVLLDFNGAPDEAYKLVAGSLSSRYFRESQRRGTGGRPHILAFDEAQKYHVPVFVNILKENRKFNMGLLLMTQEVDSLDVTLKNSLKKNAGYAISTRQEDDAKQAAELLGKAFSIEELQSLEKGREAAIRSFDGRARIKMDYPAMLWEGKPTKLNSIEAKKATEQAKEKFMELLARDHKSVTEADQEVIKLIKSGKQVSQKVEDEEEDSLEIGV